MRSILRADPRFGEGRQNRGFSLYSGGFLERGCPAPREKRDALMSLMECPGIGLGAAGCAVYKRKI
jgi:hypothetical protein